MQASGGSWERDHPRLGHAASGVGLGSGNRMLITARHLWTFAVLTNVSLPLGLVVSY